jgi:predicted metalloprotease with PDZ domain
MTPNLSYQVHISQPTSHLFEVTLHLTNWQESVLNLKMPVWTPGSYLIREYSRHLQDFSVINTDNNTQIAWQKIGKNHWQINTKSLNNITVKYRIFANELTVRTNHLDATHGYFNGAALFLYIPNLENLPSEVTIIPPSNEWKISTSLPPVNNKNNTFFSPNLDTLIDSPFEIGIHALYEFQVLDKNHKLAIWGDGNADVNQIIADTKKIIATEAKLFNGLPYNDYLFILHLSGSGFGGLEHKNSCSLIYPRLGFKNTEKYHRFLQLVAHEFFHLWNVKRIRPLALEKFDYEQENYTTSLWFSEGTTSYYDLLIPLKAGIYDSKIFLQNLSQEITKYLTTPGRKVQPLAESSFDAWIKLYRRDNHSDNNQISYYLKGELVSLLLDLLIRNEHQNKRSLDDVIRLMWQRFGKQEIGFSPEQLIETIEEIAGKKLTDFFHLCLETTEELPLNEYLEPFGLKVSPIKDNFPYLGIKLASENNKEIVKFVASDSPAFLAGIDPGDELLAINGIRVNSQTLNDRLQDFNPGDQIEITLFHDDELRTLTVKLAPSQSSRYHVIHVKNPTDIQKQNLDGWLNN